MARRRRRADRADVLEPTRAATPAQPLRPLPPPGLRRGRGARRIPIRRPVPALPLGRPGHAALRRRHWSGDINRTLATFAAQTASGLNTGLSGVPLWGTDIGGFYPVAPQTASSSRAGSSSARSARSSARMAGAGASTCRGPTAPRSRRSAGTYPELRYRLMPYAYTLAWQAHRHRPAADAPARPELPRRPGDVGLGAANSCGATISWSRR